MIKMCQGGSAKKWIQPGFGPAATPATRLQLPPQPLSPAASIKLRVCATAQVPGQRAKDVQRGGGLGRRERVHSAECSAHGACALPAPPAWSAWLHSGPPLCGDSAAGAAAGRQSLTWKMGVKDPVRSSTKPQTVGEGRGGVKPGWAALSAGTECEGGGDGPRSGAAVCCATHRNELRCLARMRDAPGVPTTAPGHAAAPPPASQPHPTPPGCQQSCQMCWRGQIAGPRAAAQCRSCLPQSRPGLQGRQKALGR